MTRCALFSIRRPAARRLFESPFSTFLKNTYLERRSFLFYLSFFLRAFVRSFLRAASQVEYTCELWIYKLLWRASMEEGLLYPTTNSSWSERCLFQPTLCLFCFLFFFPLYFTRRKITLCRTRFHRPDGRTLRFAFAFWSVQVSRCYNQKCSLKYEFLHVEQFKGGVCNEIVMNDTRSRPAGDLTRSLARSLLAWNSTRERGKETVFSLSLMKRTNIQR